MLYTEGKYIYQLGGKLSIRSKAVNVYVNNGDFNLQAVGGNILISRQWGGRMASQGGMLIFRPKGGKAWTTDQEIPHFPSLQIEPWLHGFKIIIDADLMACKIV